MPVPAIRATRESIRYGFAVGKVRVLETKIFGRPMYERLVDAGTFAEQQRILSDTVYGRYLDGAQVAADVERGLDQALDEFYGFLDEANLPAAVVNFFRERYDYQNLKGALKARLLGTPADGLLVNLGTIPVEHFDAPLEDLPAPYRDLAEHTLEIARGESDGAAPGASARADAVGDAALATVDAEVDRAMFVELVRLARESKSSFLVGLAALQIDIANVKSLLRARLADVPATDALPLMLGGGSIGAKELAKLYTMPLLEAGARLASLPVLSGIPAAELADVSRLDVLADNIVVEYLRRARMVPIGAEPVIAYVMGREAEVRAVRTVLLGRLAGLPTELVRGRLRNLYV